MPLTRRRAAAACLPAAGAAIVVSQCLIPAGANGLDESAALRAIAASPAAWTLAVAFNWAFFALMLPGVVAVLGYLRGRGRTLGLIGAVLFTTGVALSGVGLSENALELTAARAADRTAATALLDAFDASPVAVAFDLVTWLAVVGMLLALIGAVRGGLARWWVAVLWPVGFVVYVVSDQLLSGPPLGAAALPLAAAPVLLGLALGRADGVSPAIRTERRSARLVNTMTP